MYIKNIFDYLLAIILFLPVSLIGSVIFIIASVDTQEFGIFSQTRVGRKGKLFKIYKFRSMKGEGKSSITTKKTHSITRFGAFMRKFKLDELPQLLNVLLGQMSFVGPRPDVPGYADQLQGADRIILSVKPGITGPTQLKYRNEEELLSEQNNPEEYNDTVIWPDKVRLNIEYIENWSLKKDLYYIFRTVF